MDTSSINQQLFSLFPLYNALALSLYISSFHPCCENTMTYCNRSIQGIASFCSMIPDLQDLSQHYENNSHLILMQCTAGKKYPSCHCYTHDTGMILFVLLHDFRSDQIVKTIKREKGIAMYHIDKSTSSHMLPNCIITLSVSYPNKQG